MTAVALASVLRCPLCRQPLACTAPVWRCEAGHAFDVAREGYVNLLPVQHKKSLAPGDSPNSVLARRQFLDAGHYQPLRDALSDLLAPLQADSLLDLGCGEGYYTQALQAQVPAVIGVDIAKPAIRLAARRLPGVTWLVATAAQLPCADASVDVVTSLFSPLPVDEMARVLKPGGHVLVVTPAPAHLWSVREALFGEVRAHDPDKFLADFATHFTLTARHTVHYPLTLPAADLDALLTMTPYAWKARPERRAALVAAGACTTEAAFTLLRFARRP